MNHETVRKSKVQVMKKCMIMTAVVVAISGAFGMVPNTNNMMGNPTVVSAATDKSTKDKKKPVIKLKGKKKMTVEKGKKVKIPKVTAKDNKDGNITKKIKITVKKGKKSYKKIAKKIKAGKKVQFNKTGKYTITYTVKDKAGNKATVKRYVTVKKAEEQDLDEEKYVVDEVITYDGNTYKTTSDEQVYENYMNFAINGSINVAGITLIINNDYDRIVSDANNENNLANKSKYLKYLGKITAKDSKGNDISDNIYIYNKNLLDGATDGRYYNRSNFVVVVYVEDNDGNVYASSLAIGFEDLTDGYDVPGYERISNDPVAYAHLRENQED